MKVIAAIIVYNLFLGLTDSCTKHVSIHSIAIQPLDSFDSYRLNEIKKEISNFWQQDVIILNPVAIPASYNSKIIDQYSADSILELLVKINNREDREIIGITHKNLYTIKEDKHPTPMAYFDQGIFGIGHQPGNCCVMSDCKIDPGNNEEYIQSIRTIIFHEMGHNRGLQHCSNTNCLMSDQGSNIMLIKSKDFCKACRAKLMLK